MPRPPAIASVLLASVVAVGCRPDAGPIPKPRPSVAQGDAADQASHRRMLAALEQIRRTTDRDNPYQGRGPAEAARARLAALPADAPPKLLWERLKDVGYHELRLGNEEEAIRRWKQAYDLIPRLEGLVPDDDLNRTIFGLAVAHLRHGETTNCALNHSAESCILPLRGGGIHSDPSGSREAMRYFLEILHRARPNDLLVAKTMWLLNIAAMTVGEHPDGVPEAWRIPAEIYGGRSELPEFPNIAGRLGIDSFNLFGGMIVDDFNGDGRLDVMASTFDTSESIHFFRADGGGGFIEESSIAGLDGLYGGLNVVQADYDNDGDLDAYVLRGAWLSGAGRHPNSLLRNDGTDAQGHVRFTDVSFAAGLADVSYPTQTAAWADYDNDGDVDLYIGNEHGERHFDGPCQLFRNNGDGSFTDVAAEAGVDNRSFVKGVVWGDYDNDRWPDLYVSTLRGRNLLYHNNRDGSFTDVASAMGVDGPQFSFPVWFFDYDNDGNLDLFVPSYHGGDDGVAMVAASAFGSRIPWEMPRLYRGDGGSSFRDVAASLGLDRFVEPMGANFGDIDNDGWLDIYLGTGYPEYEALMPNVLYRNLAGHGFRDVTLAGAMGHLQKGHAIAFADFDEDGDQDVFAQMGGAFPGDRFADALFSNPGNDNAWITLRLVGTTSNRSAIGARIHAEVREEGQLRSIYKHVNSGGSFGSSPLRQTLGLASATLVERLEVWWPTSDLTQVFTSVEPRRMYEITEGVEEMRPIEH